jgi:hypothetical protein
LRGEREGRERGERGERERREREREPVWGRKLIYFGKLYFILLVPLT